LSLRLVQPSSDRPSLQWQQFFFKKNEEEKEEEKKRKRRKRKEREKEKEKGEILLLVFVVFVVDQSPILVDNQDPIHWQ
jgi:hypothetical protein